MSKIDSESSESKKMEDELRQSEQRFRTIFEDAVDGILIADEETKKFYSGNKTICQMLGYSLEELKALGVMDIHPKEDLPYVVDQFEKQLRKRITLAKDIPVMRKDGSVFRADIKSRPITLDGKTYLMGIFRDISDRKETEKALRESEEKYRSLVLNTPDVTWTIDSEGHIVFISPNVEEVYGYAPEEMYDADGHLWPGRIHPGDVDRIKNGYKALFKEKKRFDVEYRIKRKDGNWIWLHDRAVTTYEKDGGVYADGVFSDITESKHIQEQIKMSLNEKEALLREIHHRVKNNLQVICSLLHLQTKNLKDKHVLNIFKECQNRIKSMALIHEALYQSRSVARVSFAEYLQKLMTELFRSYGVSPDVIRLKMEVDGVSPSIDTALAFGMIINELVTNCLKHAFPENRKGEIRISVHSNDGSAFTLSVGDNGVGLPEGLEFRNTASLGMQLVCTLANQLGGTIKLNKTVGTTFEITSRKEECNGKG